MKCKECGREPMNPDANFCDYCGTPFRQFGAGGWSKPMEEIPKDKSDVYESFDNFGNGTQNPNLRQDGYASNGQNRTNQMPGNNGEKPVTVLTFIIPFLLLFIPGIGFFATIGLMIYWLVSNRSGKIRKSYAKAVLVILAVFFFLAMFEVYQMIQDGTLEQMMQEMGLY